MAYVGSTRGGPIIGDSAHSKASAIKMFTHPAPQPSNSDALLNLLISVCYVVAENGQFERLSRNLLAPASFDGFVVLLLSEFLRLGPLVLL